VLMRFAAGARRLRKAARSAGSQDAVSKKFGLYPAKRTLGRNPPSSAKNTDVAAGLHRLKTGPSWRILMSY
jgi:hypothetical protein